ncbi:MAG: hypothetical protein M3O28_12210, partial [Actinomycetota bacterium]|nr:hypothetical protein [Actinomycetota bacterium]
MPDGKHEPVKSPGLGALVRRHPALVHRASASAIGGGLVLFVIASVVNAGAAPARHAAVATASPVPATTPVPWFADLQAAPLPSAIPAHAAAPAAPAPT